MMKNKITFLVPGIMLGMSVIAAEAVPGEASPDLTVRQVNIGRQEILKDSDKEVGKANNLVLAGKYDEAIVIYNRIAENLQKYPGETFKNRYDFCKKRVEYCYFQKAVEAMRKADDSVTIGDFEHAIKLCKEAIEFCPEKKAELESKIAFYEKRRTAAVTREGRSIGNLIPGLDASNQKIELLIEQGRSLARRQEYIKAKRAFEEVLLIDPYNDVAMHNLLSVNTFIQNAAKLRANATKRRFVGVNKWAGAIPVVSPENSNELNNQLDGPVAKVQENVIEKKLKAIRIPQINFSDEQSFAEVMETLNSSCRRFSPDRTGVNFVIKDYPEEAAAKREGIKEYMKRDASVYEILEDLQNNQGFLTYRIDRNAVYVAAAGIPLEKIKVEIIDITLPAHISKNLTETLKANGIPLDENLGTSAKVLGNYVVARHTPDMLEKIKVVLEEISNDEPDMVQIMFKFLEVNQNDLDELAFNWQYSRNGSSGFSSNTNNQLMRHYTYSTESGGTRFSGSSNYGGKDDANYYFNWSDSRNNLSIALYALDWADNSSILYAPRVTTLSGHVAEINMSEEHTYAEDYENIDAERNGKYWYKGSVMPEFDDPEHLGIKFEIQPEVIGDRIRVPIHIPIKQFKEWLIYDSRKKSTSGGDTSDDGEYIKKPVFSNRSIKTEVTVRDGETVFIGGVVSDLNQIVNDKIPILGDIPLIGRLFQSKYTKSEKTNLMVFMTCRIVKADGSAKYARNVRANDNGLPEFPRNQ